MAKKRKISIVIPEWQYAKLKKESDRLCSSYSSIIRRALDEFLIGEEDDKIGDKG